MITHSRPKPGTLLNWPVRAGKERTRVLSKDRASARSDGSLPGASGRLLARINALPGVYPMPNDSDRWQFGLSSEYAFGSSYALLTSSVLLRLDQAGGVELNVAPDDRRILLRRGLAIPVPGGLRVARPGSVSEFETIWQVVLAAYAYAVGPSTQLSVRLEDDLARRHEAEGNDTRASAWHLRGPQRRNS